MNGIAFQDVHEIWWLETIGGHHWIAKRVPDDAYVVMPNQLGIDQFDLEDALAPKRTTFAPPTWMIYREQPSGSFLERGTEPAGRLWQPR